MSTINAIASGLTSSSDATTILNLQTNSVNALTINGSQIVTINNNTNSSSTSTGALVVTGGLGVGGNIYASGSVYAVDFVATGNATFGNDGTDSITIGGFFVDGTKLRTATSNGNTYSLSAYDVNDTTYRDLITLTAGNTPTLTISSNGLGSIDNMTIGGSISASGTFTTITANGSTDNPAFVTSTSPLNSAAWTTTGINIRSQARTYTDTSSAAGTVPANYVNVLASPTIASTNVVTITNAANLFVAAPASGTNTSITNNWAIWANGSVFSTGFVGTIGASSPNPGTFTSLTATSANVNVTLSPTGTGTVTINPGTAGSINNMTIGASTPASGTFTQVTRTGDISAAAWTTSGIGFRGVSSTFTDTSSSGTVSITAINSHVQHTLASTNPVTVTDAATLYIAHGPIAGTNTTITNRNALYVADGISRFLGAVTINGANVNTTISPTGTGTVTINPATAGTMNNITLTVPAGSTSIAPIRLTSGTNLSVVTAGAMEYDGTVITFTSNTNIGRVPLLQGAYTSGISGSNGVTVVASTNYAIFPTANDTITLPVGSYRVELNFRVDTNAAVSNALLFSILGAGNATCTFNGSAYTTNTTSLPSATTTAWITSQTGATITAAIATAAQRIVTIKGILRVTVSGTIIPSVQFNGAAGTMTFFADNYMIISPLTTGAATASTGGWA